MYFTILVTLGVLIFQPAMATVYRCSDSSGNVSYSKQPCGSTKKSKEIEVGSQSSANNAGLNTTDEVCREVALMARGFYPSIKRKKEVLHIFEDLGGINKLSSATINIVNYVASFRYNKSLSTSRLSQLTYKRCMRNGFGHITEKDLPNWKKVNTHNIEPEIRHRLFREQMKVKQQKQLKEICKKYDSMIKIYNKRLEAPMDDLSREKMAAERDMTQSIRDENCK